MDFECFAVVGIIIYCYDQNNQVQYTLYWLTVFLEVKRTADEAIVTTAAGCSSHRHFIGQECEEFKGSSFYH